jgi:hypothetical protein
MFEKLSTGQMKRIKPLMWKIFTAAAIKEKTPKMLLMIKRIVKT